MTGSIVLLILQTGILLASGYRFPLLFLTAYNSKYMLVASSSGSAKFFLLSQLLRSGYTGQNILILITVPVFKLRQ